MSKKKNLTTAERIRAKLTLQNVRKALAVASVALYLLAIIGLVAVRFVPAKYLLVLIPVSAIGMAVILRAQFAKNVSKAKSAWLIALSLLVGVVSIGAFSTAILIS